MLEPDRLYTLLPAVYRQRDLAQGQPLRALMAVLQQELDTVVADIDTTYDNWFVETCEEWLLPYLAELLGVHAMWPLDAAGFSQRAYVANTIAYRRRKGTAAVVEQLAFDLTGFRARAVEYFQRTEVTANLRHVREPGAMPALGGTIDLRDPVRLEHVDGPFDPHAHLADVRSIETARGRYNLPNLGVHLWRVGSAEITRSTARAIGGEVGWYRFDPHGADQPLFNVPRTQTDITSLASAVDVPHALSRATLWAESQGTLPPAYLSPDPAFGVRVQTGAGIGPALPLEICNLADVGAAVPSHRPPVGTVAVDPELGRLVFAIADVPAATDEVLVDYAYGSMGLGADVVDRTASHAAQLEEDAVTWTRYVTRNATIAAELGAVATLSDAVDAWNTHVAGGGSGVVGRIVVLGGRTRPDQVAVAPESRIYDAPTSTISLPEGARLHIVAASVDIVPDGAGGSSERVVPSRTRAVVLGDVAVAGGVAPGAEQRPGGLFLNGLSIEGRLVVEPGDLERLDLSHCDVAAGGGGIEVQLGVGLPNAALRVRLHRSRVGSFGGDAPTAELRIEQSIVQGDPTAVDAPSTAVIVEGSTLLGAIRARTLSGDDSIFDGPMDVQQHQTGCLRFSYVRPGAHGPRRYRCQPDTAMARAADAAERARLRARLRPAYVSTTFGDPGYGLLSPTVAVELATGGEDGSEVGAFHHLQLSRREANFRKALRQYLRFGLDAGLLIES